MKLRVLKKAVALACCLAMVGTSLVSAAPLAEVAETESAKARLTFVNKTTGEETDAKVSGDSYSVTLAPGYEYTATVRGVSGYAVDNATKKVELALADAVSGTKTGVDLNVVEQQLIKYSGKLTGFAADYDTSKLALKLVPSEDSMAETVTASIDSDLSFGADILPETEYTLTLEGVNDYEISSETTINKTEAYTADITVALKATHQVVGGFFGVEDLEVTALSFENVDDGYTYTASVSDNEYSISLRDGAYLAKATAADASTKTHVVVNGKDTDRDLMFVSTKAKDPVEYAADIYVGDSTKDNNYESVSDAVEAASLMSEKSADKRVTIHIAPGTYTEQVIINTPYITLENTSKTEDVIITFYYGIGYDYYSVDSTGYYNAENAYDQYEKNGVARWGTSVYVKSGATGFIADGITFENSFNRRITDEELEDGVTLNPPAGSSIAVNRNFSTDVSAKAATERAAAMCVEADDVEFINCSFYSSQDTLYTGNADTDIYFNNCKIEGQTDYIFGDGDCVFDSCELSFKGYTVQSQGGYITAAKPDKASNGYLFRNCTITAANYTNSTVTAGYYGRPWGDGAMVTFMNTKHAYEGIIADAGWADMSGKKPEDQKFKEYASTTIAGDEIATDKRVSGTVQTSAPAADVATWFGDFVPSSYVAESDSITASELRLTDNGDINIPYPGHTLTAKYSLGDYEGADASRVLWYSVDDDSKETLIAATTAATGNKYQVTSAEIGTYIKVVLIPETIAGVKGEMLSYTLKNKILDGYDNPSSGADVQVGEGINVFLAGDSTVKDYSASGMYMSGTAANEGSWGEYLQKFFDSDEVTVLNYANGGRSSRTFYEEGKLDAIAAKISKGDYLFIQFGHNDCSDGYTDRYVALGEADSSGSYPYTAPEGDTNGSFKWYMKQYIDVAKEAGATPVLVTPVSRMYYTDDGTIKAHHDSSYTSNNAYVTAVEQLAEEQGAELVDLFTVTKEQFEKAYSDCTLSNKKSYGAQLMNSTTIEGEKTHNNKLGGVIWAGEMAKLIQTGNLSDSLGKYVIAPTRICGTTTKNEVEVVVGTDGVLTAYDALTGYTDEAEYWETYGNNLFTEIASGVAEGVSAGESSVSENEAEDLEAAEAIEDAEDSAETEAAEAVEEAKDSAEAEDAIEVTVEESEIDVPLYAANTEDTDRLYEVNTATAGPIEVWDLAGVELSDTATYTNHITAAGWSAAAVLGTANGGTAAGYLKGTNTEIGEVSFDDLTITYVGTDRIYAPSSSALVKSGEAISGSNYTGYYVAGKEKTTGRFLTLNNVKKGDTVVVTVYNTKNTGNLSFKNVAAGGSQETVTEVESGKAVTVQYAATEAGNFKLSYGTTVEVKPVFERVIRYPGVVVSGKLTAPEGISFVSGDDGGESGKGGDDDDSNLPEGSVAPAVSTVSANTYLSDKTKSGDVILPMGSRDTTAVTVHYEKGKAKTYTMNVKSGVSTNDVVTVAAKTKYVLPYTTVVSGNKAGTYDKSIVASVTASDSNTVKNGKKCTEGSVAKNVVTTAAIKNSTEYSFTVGYTGNDGYEHTIKFIVDNPVVNKNRNKAVLYTVPCTVTGLDDKGSQRTKTVSSDLIGEVYTVSLDAVPEFNGIMWTLGSSKTYLVPGVETDVTLSKGVLAKVTVSADGHSVLVKPMAGMKGSVPLKASVGSKTYTCKVTITNKAPKPSTKYIETPWY